MIFRRYQRYLLGALLFAVMLDTVFDVLSLRQSQVIDATGEAVVQSYQILDTLGHMAAALRSNVGARFFHDDARRRESVQNLVRSYADFKAIADDATVKRLVSGFDDLVARSAVSSRLNLTEEKYDELSEALINARRQQQMLLLGRVNRHRRLSESIHKQIWFATVVEIVLTVLIGVSWYLIDRSRRRTQASLQAGLIALEKSEAELRALLVERSLELRSTVHDLKNPLGSIKGFSELINQESQNPDTVMEMSQTLMRISERTLDMVNSLSLEGRGRATAPRAIRPVNVAAYVEDVMMALKPQLAAKAQTVRSWHERSEARVSGDSKALWDMFMNIIGNASKFSPAGSEIRVRTRVDNDRVVIEVEDEGPGFSEADKENAFGEHARLSAKPTGGESSTGLGLFLAKQVVTKHEGQIEIRRGRGGYGARMVIELPLDGEPPVHRTRENIPLLMC